MFLFAEKKANDNTLLFVFVGLAILVVVGVPTVVFVTIKCKQVVLVFVCLPMFSGSERSRCVDSQRFVTSILTPRHEQSMA